MTEAKVGDKIRLTGRGWAEQSPDLADTVQTIKDSRDKSLWFTAGGGVDEKTWYASLDPASYWYAELVTESPQEPRVRHIVFVGEFEVYDDLEDAQTRAEGLAEEGRVVHIVNAVTDDQEEGRGPAVREDHPREPGGGSRPVSDIKTPEQIAAGLIDSTYAKIDNDYDGMKGLARSISVGTTDADDIQALIAAAIEADRAQRPKRDIGEVVQEAFTAYGITPESGPKQYIGAAMRAVATDRAEGRL